MTDFLRVRRGMAGHGRTCTTAAGVLRDESPVPGRSGGVLGRNIAVRPLGVDGRLLRLKASSAAANACLAHSITRMQGYLARMSLSTLPGIVQAKQRSTRHP